MRREIITYLFISKHRYQYSTIRKRKLNSYICIVGVASHTPTRILPIFNKLEKYENKIAINTGKVKL